MKIKRLLVLNLAAFLLFGCKQRVTVINKELPHTIVHVSGTDTMSAGAKLNFTRRGVDGILYCISMADTIPTLPFRIPHLLLYQGDPLFLHSIVSLENTTRTGDDSINAIVGVVDNSSTVNNVLKATPTQIGIQITPVNDKSGGAYYGFTKNGIDFMRGDGNNFSRSFILTNFKGMPGQVLTMNATADTAGWSTPVTSQSLGHRYFSPANGQSINIAKSAYNIINPASGLLSLAIVLPASPVDNDWFEVTFTQTIKAVTYSNGKVANNAIKSASPNNYYKKFVYRKEDMTWY